MTGTVIRIRKNGVEARMSTPGEPSGTFNVVRVKDGYVFGVVTVHRTGGGPPNFKSVVRLNWVSPPSEIPTVGDLIQQSHTA